MEDTTDTTPPPHPTERPLGFWLRLTRAHMRAALQAEAHEEDLDRSAIRERMQTRVVDTLDPDEYDALVASLQKVARAFGWDGTDRMPRGSGRHFGPGSGRGHGFGPRERFAWNAGPCADHRGHRDRGHERGHHHEERAYERGFQAGVAAASRLASPLAEPADSRA